MKICHLLVFLQFILSSVYGSSNLTAWQNLRRQKRFLIYEYGGQVRMNTGISFPVRLEDRVPYRQLNILYAFQAQFGLPTTAAMLYKSPFLSRKLENIRFTYEKLGLHREDKLRTAIYTMIEVHMNQHGQNGRECLKRAICENGKFAFNDGILAEIVHEVLRPSKFNSDKEYLDAYEAGKEGASCYTVFADCKKGDSFLDKIIFTKEY